MTLTSLGKVVVAIPGTPVALSVDATIRVARVVLQTSPANTGNTYFGQSGLSKTTLAGVSHVFPASGGYEVSTADGTDGITLAKLSVDADVAGESLLVSYWTE